MEARTLAFFPLLMGRGEERHIYSQATAPQLAQCAVLEKENLQKFLCFSLWASFSELIGLATKQGVE